MRDEEDVLLLRVVAYDEDGRGPALGRGEAGAGARDECQCQEWHEGERIPAAAGVRRGQCDSRWYVAWADNVSRETLSAKRRGLWYRVVASSIQGVAAAYAE